jgi:uncharacterized zinc-type alcohol dehydrogenase-like protein
VQTVRAYAALTGGAPLGPWQVTRRDPGPHDVAVDIAYSGICHSDIHQVNEEWGTASFPMVPGHEIVGTVTAIGDQVTRHGVGDLVGIGCFVDSCRECDACLAGSENYCLTGKIAFTYNSKELTTGDPTFGGYSQSIVVSENYLLRVPGNIDAAGAAPLLCAGITLWSPLRHWQAGVGSRVAVMGLGGLGHMGVKLAKALGAEVTVLSHSAAKETNAFELGADHFVNTSDPTSLRSIRSSFDLVLNTVSADLDLTPYLNALTLNGSLVLLGLPSKPIEFRAFTLLGLRRSMSASSIGGIQETQEMLDFCGQNNITSDVEVIAADYINEAYLRVLASDVRYRFVIDTSTI